MESVTRIGASIDRRLLARFDKLARRHGFSNRSQALSHLLREKLVEEEVEGRGEVVGTVTLVYSHHASDVLDRLTRLQHHSHSRVVSSTHVHLDEENCLEIVILRGRASQVRKLGERMISTRGVKSGRQVLTTTGKSIP
jgi:CopG family transcriptional regulator, nickel-responsive regulator